MQSFRVSESARKVAEDHAAALLLEKGKEKEKEASTTSSPSVGDAKASLGGSIFEQFV